MGFTDWEFSDIDGESLGLSESPGGFEFDVALPGLYMMTARMYLTVSPTPAPGMMVCRFNLQSDNTYSAVTRSIIIPPSGFYIETHTLGPLPVETAALANFGGRFEMDSGPLPTFSGGGCGCDFYVVKIA